MYLYDKRVHPFLLNDVWILLIKYRQENVRKDKTPTWIIASDMLETATYSRCPLGIVSLISHPVMHAHRCMTHTYWASAAWLCMKFLI